MNKTKHWLLLLGVFSLLAISATARADDGSSSTAEHTLVVNGQAEVMAYPDRARINIGAEAQASNAAAATDEVNRIMNRALDSIKKLGINNDAIQTTQVSLYPVYSLLKPGDPGPAEVVAYRASNGVQVTVEDLSLISRVLDAANTAGANRQNGVNFELKNDAAVKAGALRIAAAEAKTKAQALADALGLRLVAIKSVNESGVNIVYPRAYGGMMMRAADSSSTPIQTGQLTINATVSLTYIIAPK